MKIRALWLVLLLQILVIGGLYAYRAVGLSAGTIRLRTVPVDPRDLLRGDYVILRYEISHLTSQANPYLLGDGSVFVVLRREGDFGVLETIRASAAEARRFLPAGGCILRAELRGQELRYDLERFYVPEGTGREAPPGGQLVAEVAVRPNGNALIKQLYDAQGQPWPARRK
ncbi:MAG: GDYXXLXY domain-containing protein [Verrucomicrobia bacterium]|nr:GDYXXLXY domain-containing protein [Verrucomicrobiota bacterium]